MGLFPCQAKAEPCFDLPPAAATAPGLEVPQQRAGGPGWNCGVPPGSSIAKHHLKAVAAAGALYS